MTGLEAPMYATLRFTLDKERTLPGPHYRTPAPLTPKVDIAPLYGTTGDRRRPLPGRAGRDSRDGRPHRRNAG